MTITENKLVKVEVTNGIDESACLILNGCRLIDSEYESTPLSVIDITASGIEEALKIQAVVISKDVSFNPLELDWDLFFDSMKSEVAAFNSGPKVASYKNINFTEDECKLLGFLED